MVFVSPQIASADMSGVYALIGLISDPQASAKRLEELKSATDEANKAETEAAATLQQIATEHEALIADSVKANKLADENARRAADDQAALEQASSQFRDHSASVSADLQKRESDVKQREMQAAERLRSLTAAEADLMQRQVKLDEAMRVKELVLAQRADDLAEAEHKAEAIRADYEQRLAQLKDLLGGGPLVGH